MSSEPLNTPLLLRAPPGWSIETKNQERVNQHITYHPPTHLHIRKASREISTRKLGDGCGAPSSNNGGFLKYREKTKRKVSEQNWTQSNKESNFIPIDLLIHPSSIHLFFFISFDQHQQLLSITPFRSQLSPTPPVVVSPHQFGPSSLISLTNLPLTIFTQHYFSPNHHIITYTSTEMLIQAPFVSVTVSTVIVTTVNNVLCYLCYGSITISVKPLTVIFVSL